MPGFGGFYKGDKKKPKQGDKKQSSSQVSFSTRPVMPVPERVSKDKKKKDW